MKKIVVVLMLLTVGSKVLGFSRDITLSYFYGASHISDVFLISLTIPTVLFAIIGQGIVTGYIPVYSQIRIGEGNNRALSYTNNVTNIVLVACTIVIFLGILFTNEIVTLFAVGFDDSTSDLAVHFTRITMIGIYFTALIYIFSSYLQIKGYFFVQGVMGIPLNVCFILAIIISSYSNIYVLAVGSVIAIFSQFLLVFLYAVKKNYRYEWNLHLKDEKIKQTVTLAMPAILGSSILQVNILVDRTIASKITVGGISALNYANTLSAFVLGIFVLSISTVVFPKISKMAVEKDIEGIKKSTRVAINVVNILMVPATVGYILFAVPIVDLLFGRGAFDQTDLELTAYALMFYSLGIVGLGVREILSKAFYSLQDTKTPMINAGIALVLNIILNFILSFYLGIGGLALATSISAIMCALLLFLHFQRKFGDIGVVMLSIDFFKIVLASILMGAFCFFLNDSIVQVTATWVALVITVFFGCVVYAVLVYCFNVTGIREVALELKRRVIK